MGNDINKQKPKRLTHDLVENAGMVITMGCGAEECPLIQRALDWGIEDPKSKPMDRVREAMDEIKGRVEKLLESISSQNSTKRRYKISHG